MDYEKFYEKMRELDNALCGNGVNCVECFQYRELPVIVAVISWGDWKHDHGRADFLARELGLHKIGEKLTNEDGSDCYSSNHFYAVGSMVA